VVKSQVGFALWSRETLLLANNLVLVVAASMILLGTLYPLVLDALTGAKLSVGPPYFNALFMPLMALLMVVMASAWWCAGRTPRQMAGSMLTPVLLGSRWRRWPGHRRRLRLAGAAFALAAWVVLAAARHLRQDPPQGPDQGLPA
jgi:cytochrome c-type biogenesis protein CcmF